MYAAAGGASLAGRKARQHGRQPAPASSGAPSPPHPAPTGVRAYSCQHWESRLVAPPTRALSAFVSELHSPCHVVECAAGRAAWQEAAAISVGGGGAAGGAARRCSVLGDHPGARRDPRSKWHRTNRVRDASYGSSSDSDGEAEGAPGEPWGVARLLYAGLGTLALGLVVYFVGTGDKGFKTPALRLVGPSLIVAGLACCLLRIMFCIFAKPCCRRRTNFKESRRLERCGEGEEMPLARGPRTGPAQCSPARRLDASSCDVSSLSSGEEDERLRRYRTAAPAPAPSASQSAPAHLHQSAAQQIAVQQKQEPQTPSGQSPAGQPPAGQPPSGQPPPGQPPQGQPPPGQPPPGQPPPGQPPPGQPPPGQPPPGQPPPGQPPSGQPPLGQPPPGQPPPGQPPPGQTVQATQVGQPGPGPRRPPPRNVSFAGVPDGELVLSPAQLRS